MVKHYSFLVSLLCLTQALCAGLPVPHEGVDACFDKHDTQIMRFRRIMKESDSEDEIEDKQTYTDVLKEVSAIACQVNLDIELHSDLSKSRRYRRLLKRLDRLYIQLDKSKGSLVWRYQVDSHQNTQSWDDETGHYSFISDSEQ